jgi:hypothetical protein
VVDIGPGEGTWATALRPHHQAHWTGVEIWEPYIAQYDLASKYDVVVCADARDYLQVPLDPRTLVIAGDVLEHLPQVEAEALITRVFGYGCTMLISVPIVPCWQDAVNGNIHETHLWYPDHAWAMDTLRPDVWACGDIVGVYWCANPEG